MTESFQLDGMEGADDNRALPPEPVTKPFVSSQSSLPHSFYQSAF